MAKELRYESVDGVDHRNSYWKPVYIQISDMQNVAIVQFHGYKDRDARLSNKQPIGTKNYELRGEDFTKFFSAAETGKKELRALCYDAAMYVKEEETQESFFKGAKDV